MKPKTPHTISMAAAQTAMDITKPAAHWGYGVALCISDNISKRFAQQSSWNQP